MTGAAISLEHDRYNYYPAVGSVPIIVVQIVGRK